MAPRNKADRQAAMAAPGEEQKDDTVQTTDNPTTGDGDAGIAVTDPNPAQADPSPNPAQTAKGKSIVPSKYAGKYKDGGSSPTSMFIKDQCVGKDGFEFSAFFNLCRINGIAEDQVKRYETDIAEKKHGAQGRARMTLRNMLATIARKNGKLKAQDGTEHDVVEAKAPVSGAAAQAQANAAPTAPTESAGASA